RHQGAGRLPSVRRFAEVEARLPEIRPQESVRPMDIRAAEISAILKTQIANFGEEADVSDVGQALSVGDGIATVFGLDKLQAREMVEFPKAGVEGMARHLERH